MQNLVTIVKTQKFKANVLLISVRRTVMNLNLKKLRALWS